MKTCPACGASEYSTYANGTSETGYCMNCSYESSTPTTKVDPRPFVIINRPKKKATK